MTGFAGSLGFKLSLDWRDQQGRGLLPPLEEDLYEFLRRRGFRHFEFGVGACTDPAEAALLQQEAAACRAQSLAVCLHPYLRGAENPAVFGRSGQVSRAMAAIAEAARRVAGVCEAPVAVVLHPAELAFDRLVTDASDLRRRLFERSHLFLADLEQRMAESGGAARAVVEHQVPPAPGEDVIRIGDTYAELLDVVSGTGLGLCWDTGHYLLSVQRHGQDERPSEEFVQRVAHVHLHDVVEGEDHRVVAAGSERVACYLRMLVERGFDGAVTLEYSARAIWAAEGFAQAVDRSLRALSAWGLELPHCGPAR